MAEKTDFVGLGFCSNDYLATLPNIPMDSKVQILEHLIQGGGPAATSTVAAARLGVKSAFISSVGGDEAGKMILSDLEKEGVSIPVGVDKSCPHQIKHITYQKRLAAETDKTNEDFEDAVRLYRRLLHRAFLRCSRPRALHRLYAGRPLL